MGSDTTAQNTVAVELGGTTYRMVTDADPDQLERLAGAVDERISALGAKAIRTLSPAQVLAIASLRLAEELEGAEQAAASEGKRLRDAASEACRAIDLALDAGKSS